MEQAREAAQVVTEFFQGNPFGTQVGQKIEQATDTSLASENWALNMEICDLINNMEEGPRDAIRAIRKRLQTTMSKNNQTVMYTLTVLETCVKNCDHRLHQMVAQKEFVQELVKLIGPKYDPPQIVQEKVLSLIQAWAHAFRGKADLKGVCEVYDELKNKGVEFPVLDPDSAPIFVAGNDQYSIGANATAQHPGHATVTMPIQAMAIPLVEPVNPTPEQLVKLRKELDVVTNNLKVLREMLSELAPGQEAADDLQLLQELYTTCRHMQVRVLELLERVSNEEVTSELLLINDELNNVFAKYDRYMANRRKEQDQRNPGKQNVADTSLIDLDLSGSTSAGTAVGDLTNKLSGMEVSNSTSTTAHVQSQPEGRVAETGTANESDYKEMEAWLKQSGGGQQGNQEFEQFLTQRADATSGLPPTTTDNQQAH